MLSEIIGAVVGGGAAKDASKAEVAAAHDAANLQMQEFQQVQTEEKPYIQAGNAALEALMGGLGFTRDATAGAGGAGGATGPTAQQQLDWVKQNITSAAGYNGHIGKQVEAYLASNPSAPPDQQLAAISHIFSQSPTASASTDFQNWLKGQQGAITGTGGWKYGGPGDLNKPFDPSMLENTPGYKFTLGQGEEAILDTASARGGVGGGNTMKAITDYAEGLASTTYQQQLQDYMAQQQQRFSQFDTIAGSGQNAVANLASAGSNAANNAGNALIGAGNAQAAGSIAQGNAITGALAGITGQSQNFLMQALAAGGGF